MVHIIITYGNNTSASVFVAPHLVLTRLFNSYSGPSLFWVFVSSYKLFDAVKSLKRKSNQVSSVAPKRKNKYPEKKQNFQEPDCNPVLNLLRSNMVAWFDRQQHSTVLAHRIGYNLPINTLNFSTSTSLANSSPSPVTTCCVCKISITLTKGRDGVSFFLTYRDIYKKTCWLKDGNSTTSKKCSSSNVKKPVIRDVFKQVISATSEETVAPKTICEVLDPDNGSVRLYIPVQQQQEVETEVSFVKENVLKVNDTCDNEEVREKFDSCAEVDNLGSKNLSVPFGDPKSADFKGGKVKRLLAQIKHI